jgi:hypothetical protein
MSSPAPTPITTLTDLEKPALPSSLDEQIATLGPAPDGGARAWFNVAGAFCIFFGCLGFTSCFGVLQQYYSTHQLRDRSPGDIAWIGSMSSFIQFAGGAVGGPMFDRWGAKVCSFAT